MDALLPTALAVTALAANVHEKSPVDDSGMYPDHRGHVKLDFG
jgi:hypothetical protein